MGTWPFRWILPLETPKYLSGEKTNKPQNQNNEIILEEQIVPHMTSDAVYSRAANKIHFISSFTEVLTVYWEHCNIIELNFISLWKNMNKKSFSDSLLMYNNIT